jgi:hypothetical protein
LHRLLQKLANEEAVSMQVVLDRALEHYRRERFLRGANKERQGLKSPKEWRKVLEERGFGKGPFRTESIIGDHC